MVEKFMFVNFMVEKYMVEKSVVEPWGWYNDHFILTWQFPGLLNSYSWWVEPLILKAPENVWCQKWLRLWFQQKPKSCWPILMQSSSASSSFPKRLTSDMTRETNICFKIVIHQGHHGKANKYLTLRGSSSGTFFS